MSAVSACFVANRPPPPSNRVARESRTLPCSSRRRPFAGVATSQIRSCARRGCHRVSSRCGQGATVRGRFLRDNRPQGVNIGKQSLGGVVVAARIEKDGAMIPRDMPKHRDKHVSAAVFRQPPHIFHQCWKVVPRRGFYRHPSKALRNNDIYSGRCHCW